MIDQSSASEQDPAGADVSKPRRRLLKLLRRSDTPMDVYELADATGLHTTTVRFHLDVLVRAGRIAVHNAPRPTPGRPRSVYTIRTEEAPPDGYRPLAELLAAHLGPTPRVRRRRGEKAGRDWAMSLVEPPDHPVDTDEAARRVEALFAEMHFDPELVDSAPGTERQIRLRACPYRDVARDHPDVVCAIHLGLLEGAISQLGNPPTAVRLVPFVKPHLCVAYLIPEPPAGSVSTPLAT